MIPEVLMGCGLGKWGSLVAPAGGSTALGAPRVWVSQEAPQWVLGEGLLTEPRSGVQVEPWPWCGSRLRVAPAPLGECTAGGPRHVGPRVRADPPVASLVSLYLNLGWGVGAGGQLQALPPRAFGGGVGSGHGPAPGHCESVKPSVGRLAPHGGCGASWASLSASRGLPCV